NYADTLPLHDALPIYLDLGLLEARAEESPIHSISLAEADARRGVEPMPCRKSSAQRAAGVTRGRLDPELVDDAVTKDLSIRHARSEEHTSELQSRGHL